MMKHLWNRMRRREGNGEVPLAFRAARDVKTSMHSEGMVLIHYGSGVVFSANRAGALIWESVTAGKSLDEVAVLLGADCASRSDEIRADIVAYVAELQDRGLLVREV